VNISKLLRILIFLALTLKVTKCSKLSLEIDDFDLRAQKNVIAGHFQTFTTLYKVEYYLNVVWMCNMNFGYMNAKKIREKILFG
jgi:hypothetical protein